MDIERWPLGLLAMVWALLSKAELKGSRGRARAYGRPDPEDADWDWIIFVDDPAEKAQVCRWLEILVKDYGFQSHERKDGHFTASGRGMDIVWQLEERGCQKEEAYVKAELAMYAADRELLDELRQQHLVDVVVHVGAGT